MASCCTVLARRERGMCSPDRAASRLRPCSLQLRLTRTMDGEAERPQSKAAAEAMMHIWNGVSLSCLCEAQGRPLQCRVGCRQIYATVAS